MKRLRALGLLEDLDEHRKWMREVYWAVEPGPRRFPSYYRGLQEGSSSRVLGNLP